MFVSRIEKIAPEVQDKMDGGEELIDVLIKRIRGVHMSDLIKKIIEELNITALSPLDPYIACELTPEQIKQIAELKEVHSIWLNRTVRPC